MRFGFALFAVALHTISCEATSFVLATKYWKCVAKSTARTSTFQLQGPLQFMPIGAGCGYITKDDSVKQYQAFESTFDQLAPFLLRMNFKLVDSVISGQDVYLVETTTEDAAKSNYRFIFGDKGANGLMTVRIKTTAETVKLIRGRKFDHLCLFKLNESLVAGHCGEFAPKGGELILASVKQ